MTQRTSARNAAMFVFGWLIELVVFPFGVVTFALIGAVGFAWQYIRDVGFIARNIGESK